MSSSWIRSWWRQRRSISASRRHRSYVSRWGTGATSSSGARLQLDVFDDNFIPFRLTTVEFRRGVKARLSPDGAVVANLWKVDEPVFRAQLNTIAQVFPTIHVFDGRIDGNTIVVAAPDVR